MRWLAALLLVAAAPLAGAEVRATLCGVGVPGERQAGLDADRDGVPDSDDWCPDTQAGTRVGSNGCADWEVPARCERKPAPPPSSPLPAQRGPVPAAVTPAASSPPRPPAPPWRTRSRAR